MGAKDSLIFQMVAAHINQISADPLLAFQPADESLVAPRVRTVDPYRSGEFFGCITASKSSTSRSIKTSND